MKISEIFSSIQGEGVYTGVPMIFVRFQGCSLACVWCDSKYTWSETSKHSLGELTLQQVRGQVSKLVNKTEWVCITGGEPLEQLQDFENLVYELHADGYKIEVETSGLIPIPSGDIFYMVDSWIPDLKGPSSQVIKQPILSDLARLRPQDQLKCVVSNFGDLHFVDSTLLKYPTQATVLISPAFNPLLNAQLTKLCSDFCIRKGYRLSLQTHKFIWGEKRGV